MNIPGAYSALTRMIILIISSGILLNCSPDDEPQRKEDLRIELLKAVNQVRADGCQCGPDFMPSVSALTWNDTLQKAADNHARDMYSNGYFSHISPDGRSPIVRAQQAGYTGEYVGENIARNYFTIKDVMEGWKDSESHCKAMMDTLYNEVGASEVGGYWVMDLGRSK